MIGFTNVIRGIGGEPELSRVVGFVGGLFYIIGAHVFLAWNQIQGGTFDLVAYCLSFPAGLAAVATGTAAAVSIKDRNVEKARAMSATTDAPHV